MNDIYKNKKSPIWKVPKTEFQNIIKKSETLKEVLMHFGLQNSKGNYKTLHQRIKAEEIDISHIKNTKRKLPNIKRIPLEQILVENSTYTNNSNLKKRLVEEGLLKEECTGCGLGPYWNGISLTLQLEHKNGVSNDNRLENLCLLCPNCHSQTKTFSGRNSKKVRECKLCSNQITRYSKSGLCAICVKKKRVNKKLGVCTKCKTETHNSKSGLCLGCYSKTTRKSDRPQKDALARQVVTLGYYKTGRLYGVSDNAIRKWIKTYNLPTNKSELTIYLSSNNINY